MLLGACTFTSRRGVVPEVCGWELRLEVVLVVYGSFGTRLSTDLDRRSRYPLRFASLFLVFWPPALILFCPFAYLQPSSKAMSCTPERQFERVFKIKAPSATRRWLVQFAEYERVSGPNVHVASGRAHWQKTAPS